MISHTTQNFRRLFADLPDQVRQQAENAYLKFKENPNHPGVRFKCVKAEKGVYSARVNSDYRALGVLKDGTIIWFWIGSHDTYLRLMNQ